MRSLIRGSVKSKTNWLGLAVVVLGYLQMPDSQQTLGQYLPAQFMPLANMAVGLAVIVTRFFTKQSLADKGAPTDAQ